MNISHVGFIHLCKWCNVYPDCHDNSDEISCLYFQYIPLMRHNYRNIIWFGLVLNIKFTLGTVQLHSFTLLLWVPCSDEEHSEYFPRGAVCLYELTSYSDGQARIWANKKHKHNQSVVEDGVRLLHKLLSFYITLLLNSRKMDLILLNAS